MNNFFLDKASYFICFPRQMFEGYGKVIFSHCEKSVHSKDMIRGRLQDLPSHELIDNHEVITVESDVLLSPSVAPS